MRAPGGYGCPEGETAKKLCSPLKPRVLKKFSNPCHENWFNFINIYRQQRIIYHIIYDSKLIEQVIYSIKYCLQVLVTFSKTGRHWFHRRNCLGDVCKPKSSELSFFTKFYLISNFHFVLKQIFKTLSMGLQHVVHKVKTTTVFFSIAFHMEAELLKI